MAVNNLRQDNGLLPNSKADKDAVIALEACKPASNAARNLKRKFGSFISSLSSDLKINEDLLGGLILTESSSYGFVDGKLLIRFENHVFLKKTDNSDAASIFKAENGHYYYKDGQWNATHGNGQSSEYEAFELAKALDETAAYLAISMGLPQIMGHNYSDMGYNSAKEMFEDFSIGETNQMDAFGRFIAAYKDGNLLAACQNANFYEIGQLYNGDGQTYGPKLEKNAADYANTL